MDKKTLKDVDLKNKKVIIRVDYNVPISEGKVTSNKRIEASLPTLKYVLDKNASIILLSHLGRVDSLEDITSGKKSLEAVVNELRALLPDVKIKFINQSVGKLVENSIKELQPREILLLENTRYNDVDEKGQVVKKESKNDKALGAY
jgi:phosphoglycerate kinase